MSLASWEEEFYPVTAYTVAAEAPEDALAHSLRKWRGLTKENLARHGIRQGGRWLYCNETGATFEITDNTCALCFVHFKVVAFVRNCDCCPLTKVRSGLVCDQRAEGETGESPYNAFTACGDPGPMIALIEAAMAAQK